jgi:DNA-directed RNA polymerase specialized sigma24 family protein
MLPWEADPDEPLPTELAPESEIEPIGTVMSRLSRARAVLQQRLVNEAGAA